MDEETRRQVVFGGLIGDGLGNGWECKRDGSQRIREMAFDGHEVGGMYTRRHAHSWHVWYCIAGENASVASGNTSTL